MVQQLASDQIDAAIRIHGYSNYKVYTDALLHVGKALPSHTDMSDVLPKVILIDQAYSTNLRFTAGVYAVAERIRQFFTGANEWRAERGIVDEIARVRRSEGIGSQSGRAASESFTLLSFASKYCHFFVENADFPIYDSLALKTLKQHYKPKRGEIRDYQAYCNALDVIAGSIDPRPRWRDLDHYLWLRGRLLKDPENGRDRLQVSLAIDNARTHEFLKDLDLLEGR